MKMRERWINFFDYIVEYSLYGLIFFIPISKAAIEIFFAFAFTAFIFKKILKPDYEFLSVPTYPFVLHLFLLVFISFSALSLINSGPYFVKGLKSLFFKWIEYILIFIIVGDTLTTRKRIRNVLLIILSVSLLVGIDGLLQHLFAFEFLRHKTLVKVVNNTYAITASFNHYNDFGTYLVFILSLVVALLISKQRKLYKLVLFLLTILLIASLLLTFSRASWLGFISVLLLMLFISRKLKELVPILGIFIILLIFIPITKQRAAFTFQPTGDADRFIVWQSAFKMIKENPLLGKGIGTFMDYFHKYLPNLYPQYAHNCFLQIWAETGIFSLLSFLLFVGAILYNGIRVFKKGLNFVLLGLVCGAFGFLVHSFFDTQLYSLQLATLFWFMVGLAVAVINLEKADNK